MKNQILNSCRSEQSSMAFLRFQQSLYATAWIPYTIRKPKPTKEQVLKAVKRHLFNAVMETKRMRQ